MKSIIAAAALFASAAMAQTTSACGAAYIVEACLSGERAKLASCSATDYACQCAGWQNIITCYNNCPNDPRLFESEGQLKIFCDYASRFASTSTKATAPTSAGSTPAQATGENNNQEGTNGAQEQSGTPSSSSPTPSQSSGAGALAFHAGGALAAVAGVVAAVL